MYDIFKLVVPTKNKTPIESTLQIKSVKIETLKLRISSDLKISGARLVSLNRIFARNGWNLTTIECERDAVNYIQTPITCSYERVFDSLDNEGSTGLKFVINSIPEILSSEVTVNYSVEEEIVQNVVDVSRLKVLYEEKISCEWVVGEVVYREYGVCKIGSTVRYITSFGGSLASPERVCLSNLRLLNNTVYDPICLPDDTKISFSNKSGNVFWYNNKLFDITRYSFMSTCPTSGTFVKCNQVFKGKDTFILRDQSWKLSESSENFLKRHNK